MDHETAQLEIGKRIAECRRERKLTQEELANRVGVTAQALSQYERGLRYPDVGILASLCNVLNASADYLLGLEDKKMTEFDDPQIQNEIWWNLRHSLDPLAMEFGVDIVAAYLDNKFVKTAYDLRLRLSTEGILMPIVKLRDWTKLKPREYIITAYDNVLYHEIIADDQPISAAYMFEKLETVVRTHYGEILNVDIIKDLTDNLRTSHSALIDGIVPEKVPYGQILTVCRALLKRGDTMKYLPKILEGLGEVYRVGALQTDAEIVAYIANLIERKDNKWVRFHDL